MNAFEDYIKKFNSIVGYRKDGAIVSHELTVEELKSLWYAACEWQKKQKPPKPKTTWWSKLIG